MNSKKQTHTRKEKIQMLQDLKGGKLRVEQLQPPKIYIFREDCFNPGNYEMNGKKYNETEYRDFCKKIEHMNNNSIVWHEMKTYPKENTVITVRYK